MDEDNSCIASLYELNNRCLAKLRRKGMQVGWGSLPRELAIYHSKLDPVEQRERLIIDICGSKLPKRWREQKHPVIRARLLSISTDGMSSTLRWPDMHLPETEALVLNLRKTEVYALPGFVKKMEKLKVLVITAEDVGECHVSTFQQLSSLSNLKRMRLERITISSKNSMQIKSIRKLSLIRCYFKDSVKLSDAFTNLEEMYIDDALRLMYTPDLLHRYYQSALCDLISLKNLTIVGPRSLFLSHTTLPDVSGDLVNLEVLRLRSMRSLFRLPDSMKNLKKLNFLGIVSCRNFMELPVHIGEMRSLTRIDTRYYGRLKKLPQSVLDLKQLEEVICDEPTKSLQRPLLPSFRDRNQYIRVVLAPPDSEPCDESSIYNAIMRY